MAVRALAKVDVAPIGRVVRAAMGAGKLVEGLAVVRPGQIQRADVDLPVAVLVADYSGGAFGHVKSFPLLGGMNRDQPLVMLAQVTQLPGHKSKMRIQIKFDSAQKQKTGTKRVPQCLTAIGQTCLVDTSQWKKNNRLKHILLLAGYISVLD